jgi:O-antigen/teichoic acid export membrane protein
VFQSLLGASVILSSLNMSTAISRNYYEKNNEFKSFLSTTIVSIAILVLLFSLLVLVFGNRISGFFDLPIILVYLLVPTVILTFPPNIFETLLVTTKKSKPYLILTSANAYVGMALSVILVLYAFDQKYFYRLLGTTIVLGFYAVYALIKLWPDINIRKFNIPHLKYNLSYSFPLLPYAISGIVLGTIDRLVLMKYANASETGIYSLSYNVGMLTMLVAMAGNQAFLPNFFEWMNDKKLDKIKRSQELITYAVVLFSLLLIFFGRELVMVLSAPSFFGAIYLIPVIVCGYVFFSISNFTNHYFAYHKKTGLIALTNVSVGVFNLLMNICLIPIYGKTAAAWITLASFLLLAVTNLVLIRFLFEKNSFSLSTIQKPLLLFFIGYIFFYGLSFISILWVSLLARLAIISLIILIATFQIKKQFIQNGE